MFLNTKAADAFDYCATYVRGRDEDRWLSAQYAPREIRRKLIAVYALHLEIAEVASKVSEPATGQIRLRWWLDALSEIRRGAPPRAHPSLVAAEACGVIDDVAVAAFEGAIEARAQALVAAKPFDHIQEGLDWLGRTEAPVARLSLRAAGFEKYAESDEARGAAIAFGLARGNVTIAPHLEASARKCGRELYASSVGARRRLPPAAAPAVLHFALTESYLRNGRPPSSLAKRWSLFLAMAGLE